MNTALDYYSSSDLGLSTVLSLYYPIDFIDKSNPQKVVFNFKREAGLDDLVANYWARRLQIEPQALLSQLKSIKTRLYEQ
jgi:hypothetical protein